MGSAKGLLLTCRTFDRSRRPFKFKRGRARKGARAGANVIGVHCPRRGTQGALAADMEWAGVALYLGYDWDQVTGDGDLSVAAESAGKKAGRDVFKRLRSGRGSAAVSISVSSLAWYHYAWLELSLLSGSGTSGWRAIPALDDPVIR